MAEAQGTQDGDALARELALALREDRPPRFGMAPVNRWISALDELVASSRFELAHHALRHLVQASPDLPWPRQLLTLLDGLPKAGPDDPPFQDRGKAEVQLVRREGADTLVFAFCGARIHRMGMPLSLFQRWINPLNCHVVYLRDFRHLAYQGGIPSLGADQPQTVQALKRMAANLGARRVLCVGMSAGGYGALSCAAALGAERVLAFSPAINLDAEFNTFLTWSEAAALLRRWRPDGEFDLRPRLARQGGDPPALIVYGRQCWDDRFHVEYAADLPGLSFWPLEGFRGHQSPTELVRRGEFGAVLQALAAA